MGNSNAVVCIQACEHFPHPPSEGLMALGGFTRHLCSFTTPLCPPPLTAPAFTPCLQDPHTSLCHTASHGSPAAEGWGQQGPHAAAPGSSTMPDITTPRRILHHRAVSGKENTTASLGGVLFCCNGVAKQKLIHWGCVCAQEQPGGHKVWISPSLEQGSHGTARRFPVSCHTVISVSVQTLLGCFWD